MALAGRLVRRAIPRSRPSHRLGRSHLRAAPDLLVGPCVPTWSRATATHTASSTNIPGTPIQSRVAATAHRRVRRAHCAVGVTRASLVAGGVRTPVDERVRWSSQRGCVGGGSSGPPRSQCHASRRMPVRGSFSGLNWRRASPSPIVAPNRSNRSRSVDTRCAIWRPFQTWRCSHKPPSIA